MVMLPATDTVRGAVVGVIVIPDGVEHGVRYLTAVDTVRGVAGDVIVTSGGLVSVVKYLKQNIAIIMDPLMEMDMMDMDVIAIPDGWGTGAKQMPENIAVTEVVQYQLVVDICVFAILTGQVNDVK